ncbi:patatin-like phospholipase family protein [Sandaracinus amylolyticus]|uniref:Uncharacterized protein n=1 Tax=Sandaracinus amylolyticus TaxID=927083 RepID=A0A0F6SDB3_9BACT|nr:patatin-like phospholipase family protein [Sandaracinus amylolyticus]AKF03144.1 Hypothetical protein DB32_000293 [Sandaracinus amylolyticus]
MSDGPATSVAELQELLAIDPAFSALSEDAITALARVAERVFVPAGARLMEPGPPPDSAFLVVRGRLRATDERASQRAGRVISLEMGRGAFCGLSFVVARASAAGQVLAMRDSTVLRFHRDALLACMLAYPELVTAQARVAYENAVRTHTKPSAAERPRVLTVLPIDPELAIDELVHGLARALGALLGTGSVARSAQVAERFGGEALDRDGFDRARHAIAGWCSEQEARGFLVLVCDRDETPWTAWCLEQTDRVVVAARPSAAAQIERAGAMLARRSSVRTDLVLVHEADTAVPRGTAAWLALPCRRRHHVRRGRAADLARVARHVAEQPITVVLGGGGARALAHIGVLRALDEAGIPIDAIAGTSMGAVVAAGYALGVSPREIAELFAERVPDARALRDPDVPVVSLLAGRKLDRVLRDGFADVEIPDLWLPCFCIATDISQAVAVVHDRGLVWRSVRASCSLPGVFPPVQLDGRLLVDGGVIDNVPIDVMERECPGATILAVDVGSLGIDPADVPAEPLPTGWTQLGERLRGSERRSGVTIMQLLTATAMLGSKGLLSHLVAEGHAELFLAPPVKHIKLLDFGARPSLVEIGYTHAQRALASWSGTERFASRSSDVLRRPSEPAAHLQYAP